MADTTPPSIIVSANTRRLTAFQTTTITFNLSEPSSNFTIGDVYVYGGTLSNFSGSGNLYTADYTAQFTGFVRVPSNVFTDSAGNANTDGTEPDNFVSLVVNQLPPQAIAGLDQYAKTGAVVTLNGTNIYDPEGDQLSYRWSITEKPVGSSPVLTNPLSAQPTFSADLVGNYLVALEVSDGFYNKFWFATIFVRSPSRTEDFAPIAVAGPSQAAKTGETVTLDGTNSFDPNGNQLTYQWQLIFKPFGSSTSITNPLTARPTFVPDLVGDYIFILSVNDGSLYSSSNGGFYSTVIKVSSPNTAPVANAGSHQNLVLGPTTLDGTASFDADGDKLNYKWYLVSKPNNSKATLSSTASSKPTFTTDIAGEYLFTLVVNDGKVESSPAHTVVIANPSLVPDTTSPTIRVVGDETYLRAGLSKKITFYLSEPSSNFTLSDVSVTGGTLSNWVGSGDTYSALFTPLSNSTIKGVVSVPSGVFTDSAQNVNADGSDANNSVAFSVDTVFPTIVLSTNKTTLSAGETAVLTFTLSESSTNFTEFDVTVSGGTLSNFSGSGSNYTAIFNPSFDKSGISFISVPSGAFKDFPGNNNIDGFEKNNSVLIAKETVNLSSPTSTSFPIKTWTTLFGSVNDDVISALVASPDGSIYVSTNITGYQTSNYATLTKYSQDGTKLWEQKIGSTFVSSTGIITSALSAGLDGSIYISGTSYGNNGSHYGSGFLTKYSSNGTQIWSRELSSSRIESASALVTGLDGSIYLSGVSIETPATPYSTSAGFPYLFLSKYEKDGSKAWSLMSDTSLEVPADLAIGIDGAVYITGRAPGKLSADVLNNQDIFLTKYGTDGKKVWSKLLGSNKNDEASSITTGLDGAIYIIGNTYGSFEGQAQIGGSDIYLTKFSPDGAMVWSKIFGSKNNDFAKSITTGLDGSIYVTGYTYSSLDGEIFSQPQRTFVSKFNIEGETVWSEFLGESGFYSPNSYTQGNNSPTSLITDTNGSIYVGIQTYGSLEGQNSIGGYDAFLAKFEMLKVVNYQKNLTVIVNKGVLGAAPVLLKDLIESTTYTDGSEISHTVKYAGSTFDYDQIDLLITTVTRDGEFTTEFTKEINDYMGTELNIAYSAAVKLVGAASIDAVILSVAGADGNYVG